MVMKSARLSRSMLKWLPLRFSVRLPVAGKSFPRTINTGARLRRPSSHPDGNSFDISGSNGAVISEMATTHLPYSDAPVPGKHVHDVSKKYDISFPKNLRKLGVKLLGNYPALSIQFSQHHCFDNNSMRWLDRNVHPAAQTVLDRYIAQKKIPLWYRAISAHGASPLVSSEAKRRIKQALRLALGVHGYDPDGRRIVPDGEESAIKDLYGTLKITCHKSQDLCKMEFANLLKLVKPIVTAAELEMRRDHDDNHITSGSGVAKHRARELYPLREPRKLGEPTQWRGPRKSLDLWRPEEARKSLEPQKPYKPRKAAYGSHEVSSFQQPI
ncbi:uncharacterized protein BCR38DRAFT_441455 [Pseudomassariella vexata]|uniref:Uncharacterized protein n=1 Tax=Pseudomassariella vexata TaxID=1141098 RepID=A0A1Y2DMR9_9PEZI|nr:uncharacterized protein BCR38DRAFT_441455 [Pseudomassariella vexata]ORY60562.1 hypothetical protein BCR38DRAFT_441455 [Pseudomassariella vexata]